MRCSTSSSPAVRRAVLLRLVVAAFLLAVLAQPRLAGAASLAVTPMTVTVAPLGSQAFAASGGSGAGYAWSMAAAPSGGKISSSGVYTAGPTPNVTDQVQVTDSAFDVVTATVNVSAALAIVPPGITLATGNMQQFTATGGKPPYSWSLVQDQSGGSIDATGLYAAGSVVGSDTVRAADANGNAITAPVTVVSTVPLGTACTAAGTCPATSDGNAYCVDGVCCDSACSGQCQACDTASSLGTCATVTGPPVGTRTACPVSDPNNVCSGKQCDGKSASSCDAYVGTTTQCGGASCVDLVGTPAAVCQGDGTCQTVTQQACGPFACVSDQCATSCTDTAECSPGNYCDVTTGQCVVPAGQDGGPPVVGPDAGGSSGASASSSSGCGVATGPGRGGAAAALLLAIPVVLARRRLARRQGC